VVDHRNTAVLLLPTQEVFDGLDSAGYCDCLRSSRHDEHEALGGFFKVRSVSGVLLFYALSIIALTFAVNRLDVSVAYAVWSGMGTALVAMIGLWFFKESLTTTKLIALGFIIVGVAMLHLTSEPH
jgi:small multidrug resistance pump